jgi:putative DNA primase/helicase
MSAAFGLRSLARALGGEVAGAQVLAPGPRHGPRDRSLSVRLSAIDPDGFITHSFAADDFRDCRAHVLTRLGLTAAPYRREPPARKPRLAPSSDDEARREHARRIASEIVPLIGTPGERYFAEARKIDVTALRDVFERTDAIGWHPSVYFNKPGYPLHGQRIGCIVGIMTDPVTATPTGAISRTYLTPELAKIGKAKTLGSPVGIIRLSRDEDVLLGLDLAEGLETALSLMTKGFRPMWAAGSTSLMRAFPVLSVIEFLTLFVDHDENHAGEEAARAVEARWRAVGREVRLRQTDQFGDFNDAVMGEASEAGRNPGGVCGESGP